MIKKIVQQLKSGNFILSKVIVTDHKGIGIAYNSKEYTALWDTGANKSIISEKVAMELNLKPISTSISKTPNSISNHNVYNISLIFQNEQINILEFDVLGGIQTDMPWDVIVGMDIISLGKFSLIPISENVMKFVFEVDY